MAPSHGDNLLEAASIFSNHLSGVVCKWAPNSQDIVELNLQITNHLGVETTSVGEIES
jgi:hypothetical protein